MPKEVLHYPTLKTVLMVEKVIEEADLAITRAEIKRRLPVKIMHQTLNAIIAYLEERGMVADTRKGVVWIYNPSPELEEAIRKGKEM